MDGLFGQMDGKMDGRKNEWMADGWNMSGKGWVAG